VHRGRVSEGEVRVAQDAQATVDLQWRAGAARNHTGTHLLHAALRSILGQHVRQQGSLVAPDRLRFDFTHHGPIRPDQLERIEELVNREIWRGTPVGTREMPYKEALAEGAMALFGEKYGDRVRVVSVPGFSTELCGGTHVRNTGEIGLFRILSESGVAAGVRRVEAATAARAYEVMRERERALGQVAQLVKAPLDGVARRVQQLVDERRGLEKKLEEAQRGGGDQVQSLVGGATRVNGARVVAAQVNAADVKSLQALGDALREQLQSGVAVIGASFDDGKSALLGVVTDDLRDRGVRADAVIKEVAAVAGGRGGGKAHMAQAGVPDAARLPDALREVERVVRALLGGAA
jgi:alanyl-tRNA synthetase